MIRNYRVTALVAFAVLTGCATEPEPFEISNVDTMQATVVAVNAAARTLVLRGPEGNQVALTVGPEVRNLAQVEAGDTLRVRFYTGFLVAMATPGDAGADLQIATGRAAEGARPGAVAGATTRATVEVLSVAKDGTSVSFRDPDGQLHSKDVLSEKGQAFVRKLKQGDLVDIQYTAAVAIDIEAP
jgi:hypothetical protein